MIPWKQSGQPWPQWREIELVAEREARIRSGERRQDQVRREETGSGQERGDRIRSGERRQDQAMEVAKAAFLPQELIEMVEDELASLGKTFHLCLLAVSHPPTLKQSQTVVPVTCRSCDVFLVLWTFTTCCYT